MANEADDLRAKLVQLNDEQRWIEAELADVHSERRQVIREIVRIENQQPTGESDGNEKTTSGGRGAAR